MKIDRTRASWIISGIVAVLFVPLHSNGVEMKRLPSVESEGSNAPPTNPRSPADTRSVPKAVRQLVWHQPEADPPARFGTDVVPTPIQLANFNEDSMAKPMSSRANQPGLSTAKLKSQLAAQPGSRSAAPPAPEPGVPRAPVPVAPRATPPAVTPAPQSTTQPAPEPADEPTAQPSADTPAAAQPSAETIEPGDGSANADDDADCAAGFAGFDYGLPPCWYIQGDALVLGRSDVRTIKIVEHGTGVPVRGQRVGLLTTDALDPNWAWGPRITIGRYLNDVRNLEMTYFGFNHFKSVAAFDGINGPGFSFNNIDVPFWTDYTRDFDGAQYVSATYASEIHSAEINLLTNNRWDLNQSTGYPWYYYVDFLAGVRYFNLNEQFDLASTDAGRTSNYLINTTNHLIGGQIGMIAGTYQSERISWYMATKAGIYNNSASQSTLLRDDNNTVLLRDFNTHANELAFVGDTSFNIAYNLRPNMALTVGYYFLYVGGVALAPEQLDFSTNPTSGSGLNQNGGAFYNGATFGLRFVY